MAERAQTTRYDRNPGDVIRLVVAAIAVGFGLLLALAFEDAVTGFERDLVDFVRELPDAVERSLIGIVQVVAIAVPAVVAVSLVVLRRFRALGYAVLACVVAAGLDRIVLSAIHRLEPSAFVSIDRVEGWIGHGTFPDSPYLAGSIAILTVLAPWLTRPWRRGWWILLWIAVVTRLIAATELPATLIFTLAFGWLIGSAVLLAFGSPVIPLTVSEIADALGRAAVPMRTLEPAAVDARGSTPYFGEATDGRPLFVKALTDRERSADILFRVYRWARFRHIGDERPFSSLRRGVEHEALCALAAAGLGVRTPALAAVAATDPGAHGMVLAYERVAGRSLDSVPPEGLDDEILTAIWQQVAVLRKHRVAHRDLRLANVFLDDAGTPWIIDFGFSELAARDEQLATDVAELLASTATVVGAERAVEAALSALSPEAVVSALPRLQPNALSGATRTTLREDRELLAALRREAEARTGAGDVPLEKLERVSPRTIFTVVALVGVFYFLLPQFADLPGAFRSIRGAAPGWVVAAVVMSAFSYLGATMSMLGSVTEPLAIGPTFEAQLASTFTNRVTPAQAGGYALNVRYLQRAGMETADAVTAVGINSIGGAAVHIPLIFVFLAWAGADGLPFDLPDLRVAGAIAAGFVVLSGALLALGSVRAFIRKKVLPPLVHALSGVRGLLGRPSKVALVLGGSFVVTMSYAVALYFSLLAFGGGLPFAQVAFAYLVGSAVATAAPTPGGLGAAEAALLAGLSAFGLPNAVGLPAVFLFRLATFWLPIVPGWLALRGLRQKDAL